MSLDKTFTRKRLDELWADSNVKVYPTRNKKWAIISDIHMGNGSAADNFRDNINALIKALEYYHRNKYSIILLGDIEELWQFDLEEIVDRYERSIYNAIKLFVELGVHRIFGNHDLDWKGIWDPTKKVEEKSVFADEAIKLRDHKNEVRFLLVHGHQGSKDSDKNTWFSRYWVRMFRFVEPVTNIFGLFGHKSATQSMVTKDYEATYYKWAKNNGVIIVCGHSHRAIFGSKSYAERLEEEIATLELENRGSIDAETFKQNKRLIAEKKKELEHEKERGRLIDTVDPGKEPLPCYFNTGCGLYTDGMTALEIDDDNIRLIKWNKDLVSNQYRKELVTGHISEVVDKIETGN